MESKRATQFIMVVVGVVLYGELLIAREALAAPAPQQVAYFNNFEDRSDPLSEWSNDATAVTPVGARRFLGQFSGNTTTSLALTDLPAHTEVTVSFDLFLIRSWDGNGTAFGPDVWGVRVKGGATLFRTTFNNHEPASNRQAYPDAYPGGDHPAGTGATEIDTLGYSFVGDSVYHLTFTFAHTASSLVLNFFGKALQGVRDESWGLDNVEVSVAASAHVGGTVMGVSTQQVTCQNITTGQSVVIRDGASSWNCSAAGLTLQPGDSIEQIVKGLAD